MQINLPSGARGRLLGAAVAGATVLAPTALAQTASAATIASRYACYANVGSREATVTIVGTGFTPGDDITVTGASEEFFAHGAAAADGSIVITGPAPSLGTLSPVVKTFTLSAQDETTGDSAVLAQTPLRVTNFAVSLSPTSVKNVHRDKVRYRFSGFRPGRRIYAYYRRKTTLGRLTFGKAKAPCGTTTARALLFPGGHPSHDKYTVTFEQTSRYSGKATRYVSTLNLFTF